MPYLSEKIHILYEIAMSIAEGPDLPTMAKRTLLTLMKKLNCPAGAIYTLHNDANGDRFRELVTIPRNIKRNATFQAAEVRLGSLDCAPLHHGSLAGFPIYGTLAGNNFFYILGLPSFGLMVLIKTGMELQADIVYDLEPLSRKLADTCTAWLAKQRLKENESILLKSNELLEQLVQKRVEEYQKINSILNEEISERKHAEDSLQKSESLFHNYFDLGQVGMAITSIEKGWLNVNNCLCELLGYTQDELRKTRWPELTHPDDLEADLIQFERILSGEIDRYTLDKRFIHKSGRIVYTHLTVACQRNQDNSVEYIIASVQDITARKEAEQEREKLIEELQVAIEEIQTLKGIIPICASCKKIRDDKGSWKQVETYLSEHSDIQFSHSICEDCMIKLYPEIYDDQGKVVR